jgi:hypothetical protein
MVAVAETIMERRSGALEPASFRNRYLEALCELVEAKTKGRATTLRTIAEPPKVINPMEALKRSVARGAEPEPNTAKFGEAGMRPILRSIRSGRISAWSMRPGIGTRLTMSKIPNCYPPQNARIAFCRAPTLGNPRAAAAALRPRNCRASAETLRP